MQAREIGLSVVSNQDGAALLDIERGLVLTLNPTGALILQKLQKGEALDAIVAELARETGEDIQRIQHDVREFIESLKETQLLKSR